MSLRDLLAELQKEYLATFPEKANSIQACWTSGRLEDLETEFHKLKGTGRTYGLPEVSQLGAAMERLCEAKSEQLTVTVPLACALLLRIAQSRTQGQSFEIENDESFRTIVSFVAAA